MKSILLVNLFLFISIVSFAQQYDSEILNDDSEYKITGDKLILTRSVVLQINNRMGDDHTQIVIPYSKSDKLIISNAQIEDSEGNIVRILKKNEIEERSAVSNSYLYSDYFIKFFDLKHNVYPYRVTYSYKVITSNFVHLAFWRANNGLKQPIRHASLSIDTPLDYPIRFSQKNVGKPLIKEFEGSRQYIWHMSYTPHEYEIYALKDDEQTPEISVVPINFKYGEVGSWDSWSSFGQWITKLNRGLLEIPLTEQHKIDLLLQGVEAPKEKAKILYKYLQTQTRYINVSINLGGLKSYSANYVSENKYGDCKALCTFMMALLSYAKIPSYYTLIEAGDTPSKIDKEFPFQAFNHVIVTVPFETDTVFLECTDKNIPFGYQGTFTQNRDAFIINGNNSQFVKIPALSEADVLMERIIDIEGKNNLVTITSIERGDDYEYLLSVSSNYRKATLEKFIKEKNRFIGSIQLEDYSLIKNDNNLSEIQLMSVFQMQNVMKSYGNNIFLTSFPTIIPNFEQPSVRKKSVEMNTPIAYKDSILYRIDTSPEAKLKLPVDLDIETKYGFYKIKYSVIDGSLLVNKDVVIKRGVYTIEEYAEFYKFVNFIKNNELKNIYIELL